MHRRESQPTKRLFRAAGPAKVRRCELTPGGWRLTVAVAGAELPVFSRQPVAADAPGRLHHVR